MADTLVRLDAPAFFGQVGTSGNGWAEDERPKSFREKILQLDPNGMAQITGLSSKLRNEKVTDPEFIWWEKTSPKQAGEVTDAFTTKDISGSGTPVSTVTAAGQEVSLKLSSDTARHFRPGSALTVFNGYDMGVKAFGKVSEVLLDGATSRVSFVLINADSGNVLSGSEMFVAAAGNINPEGSFIPNTIGYKSEKKTGFTQIFRNPYQLTRTAAQTKLRTRDPYQSLRQEQLMLHGIDIERAVIFGEKSESTNTVTGEPERTMGGIIEAIPDEHKVSFYSSTDSEFAGTAWDDTGIDFVERYLEHLFQYGSMERMAYCGSGALRGLNKLARLHGHIEITSGQTAFGLKVTSWASLPEDLHAVVGYRQEQRDLHPVSLSFPDRACACNGSRVGVLVGLWHSPGKSQEKDNGRYT